MNLKVPSLVALLPLLVGGGVALQVAPVQAQSFNCAHAVLPAEIAICGNANLSRLDEQTTGMYFLIIGSGAPAATIALVKSQQGKFLTTRNACGADIDCLVSAYTDQIMFLSNEKSNLGL
ncbi:MAG: lysozyme inhibitor LprI family protein [Devosia sp.]